MDTNVDAVMGLYQAFAVGDVPSVLGALDPQVDWREAENFPYDDGNPYIGPDAVLQGVFMRIGADWDGFVLKVEQVLAVEGDRVLATGRYQGTHKASGGALDAQFAHLWQLSDGLVVSFQQYTDTFQARTASGMAAG
jgi:uncharacterized protein